MERKLIHRLLLTGLLTAALAIGAGLAYSLWRDYRSPGLEEALRWLPADTEAVACVDEPLSLPDFESQDKDFISEIPQVPMVIAVSSQGLEVTQLFKLPSSAVDRSIVGMRNFGIDAEGNLQTFEGASIFVFAPGNIASANALFAGLSKLTEIVRATERLKESVAKVSTGNRPAVNSQNGLFVERPREAVIVVATSAGYLREVLARMKERIFKSPMAPVAREGQLRSAGSRKWAYRAFDRGTAAGDPFSPRRPDPRGGDALDPEAKDIFVSAPPGNQPGLDLEYSSEAPDALQRIQGRWRVFRSQVLPTVKDSQPGRVHLHFSKSPAEHDLNDSLLLYFGMGAPE